jgi:predicted metal-dependent enzyme (double-stranded beta helix superfamily)
METQAFVNRMSALWKSEAGAADALAWRPLSSTTQEMLAVAAFAAALDGHGDLRVASMETRLSVLGALQAIAGALDLRACKAPTDRYGRRVLLERTNWSLAAITLRAGQETEAHDHDGWGCVVTVQGVERDRRYRASDHGLVLISERDYLPGSGYIFDPVDIHQPGGGDPDRLTVALHFLVHDAGARQRHHEQPAHSA